MPCWLASAESTDWICVFRVSLALESSSRASWRVLPTRLGIYALPPETVTCTMSPEAQVLPASGVWVRMVSTGWSDTTFSTTARVRPAA